jgi:hypothetical protein
MVATITRVLEHDNKLVHRTFPDLAHLFIAGELQGDQVGNQIQLVVGGIECGGKENTLRCHDSTTDFKKETNNTQQ